jgi:hypothetical protein
LRCYAGTFILPRERDLHAIAARPAGDDRTGLYI